MGPYNLPMRWCGHMLCPTSHTALGVPPASGDVGGVTHTGARPGSKQKRSFR